MNEMELQDRQYELDGASNVYVGPPGADGITPTVIVEDITGGHQVSFYYGAGDSRNKSFTVPNGQNGTDGADGITPSMSVSDITGGHRLTITYAAGDSRNFYIDIMNGANGKDGAAGQAATVSIGTVETLPAGSSAYVVNAGTETAAVLNIGIPQGADGSSTNVAVVNFTYSSSPYSLTADKTYQEVKAVLDAGGFAVAIVNHGYSMYELTSVSDVQITFTKHTFTEGTNSGVKIARSTFSLLSAGGCGSVGSERTYGGNYPVWTLKLAVTDDGYSVKDYDISWLERIIGQNNADFQVWVYPSDIAYYNDSEYDVYRLQKAEQWYDGETQLSMTAGEFVNITDGKVKRIRIEMEEYGEWGNADYIYTETAL
jgi:hypothetical protein